MHHLEAGTEYEPGCGRQRVTVHAQHVYVT